jgi:phosphohistidine phosphatase
MRRLLILRHAKAGPHDEKHDKERQLIDRGRRDSALMGRMMHEKGYVPELVLCSSAARTRETWEHTAPELHAKPETKFLDALYDASAGTILNCLHKEGAAVPNLLYIGHNPGLEQLVRVLVRDPETAGERQRTAALLSNYPTAALTVIDFDVDCWAEIAPTAGILIDFVTPADLKNK